MLGTVARTGFPGIIQNDMIGAGGAALSESIRALNIPGADWPCRFKKRGSFCRALPRQLADDGDACRL